MFVFFEWVFCFLVLVFSLDFQIVSWLCVACFRRLVGLSMGKCLLVLKAREWESQEEIVCGKTRMTP